MRKLKISRTNFELAFELSSYETAAYLDTETGAMVFVEDDAANQLEELLTDEETLEDIQAALQAQTDLSDTDREQLITHLTQFALILNPSPSGRRTFQHPKAFSPLALRERGWG